MRIAAVAALLAVALPSVALADPVRKAASAEAGRTAAAERPIDEAQYQLGLAYRKGRGVKADPKMAYQLFALAAVNGSTAAAIEAAKARESGTGIDRDPEQAGQWWYLAARQGNAAARQTWIDRVLTGKLVSVGGVEGAGWLAGLAREGDRRAALALAAAYENGNGVAIAPAEAEHWYRVAALMLSDLDARFRLGRMTLARPAAWRVPADEEWSPKEAERRNKPFGAVWYATRPTEAGDKATMFRPGIEEGARWLTLAARQGHAEAQYHLGKAMVEGLELAMDLPAGIAWLRAASAQNHPAATMMLAGLMARGEGVFAKDPIRAYALYDLAAGLGHPHAAEARDALGRSLTGRQLARGRQLAQDLRDYQ